MNKVLSSRGGVLNKLSCFPSVQGHATQLQRHCPSHSRANPFSQADTGAFWEAVRLFGRGP